MAQYYLQDDYTGTATSGGSGQQMTPYFTANTLLQAQLLAQQYATIFARNCRLVPLGGTPPYTMLYTPGVLTASLSNPPTGISF